MILSEWLEKAPSDWLIAPAWSVFAERSERAASDDVHLTPSQLYGVIPQDKYMEITGNRVVLNLTGADKMKAVRSGDFISHLRSFQGGLEASYLDGKVSAAYTVLRPLLDVHNGYFRHLMKSSIFVEQLNNLTDQLRDGQTINYARFARMTLPVPPPDTQRAIADYLDRETGEIDATIAKMDELAETLESRRLGAISELFVDGKTASKSAPLWKFGEVNAATPEFRDLEAGATVTFMPLETIWPGARGDYSRQIVWESKLSYTQFRKGDILVPKITPTFEAGRSIIAEVPTDLGLASTEVHVVRPNQTCDPRFLCYAFQTEHFLSEGAHSLVGVGNLRRVSGQFIQSHKLPDIPYNEQSRIADHLDEVTGKIDAMLAKVTELKSLLIERRAALITDVVTGRKKVA